MYRETCSFSSLSRNVVSPGNRWRKTKRKEKEKKKREGTRRINGATLIALRTGERALSKSVLNLFPALLGLWNTEAKREKETRE